MCAHHARASRSAALTSLGVAGLWAGLLLAARDFPTEFDWRYMTMSVLLSPKDNPAGRHWAEAGIALCGLAVCAWTFELPLADSPAATTRRRRRRGISWLRWGGACMIGAGVLPLRLPGLAKGHEILTLFAFTGLCVGMVRLTLDRARQGAGRILAGVLIGPIVLAGLAQLYVFYVLPELHWVGLAWRAQGVPVYLSFAFWEWVTGVVLSAYLALLGVALQRERD